MVESPRLTGNFKPDLAQNAGKFGVDNYGNMYSPTYNAKADNPFEVREQNLGNGKEIDVDWYPNSQESMEFTFKDQSYRMNQALENPYAGQGDHEIMSVDIIYDPLPVEDWPDFLDNAFGGNPPESMASKIPTGQAGSYQQSSYSSQSYQTQPVT